MTRIGVVSLLAPRLAAVALAGACASVPPASPCRDVPPYGCPLSHDQACSDPSCAAAYACNPDGTWTLDHVCPGFDASAPEASSLPEAAPPNDVSAIDAPPGANGGPGCATLQISDCPLAFAMSCPRGCCDCADLYVCTAGSWDLWGSCREDDAGAGSIAPTNPTTK